MADWSLVLYDLGWAAFLAMTGFASEHLYEVPSLRASHRSACFRGWSGGPAFQTGSDVQPRKGATHFEPGYLTLPEALAVSASAGCEVVKPRGWGTTLYRVSAMSQFFVGMEHGG